MDVLVVGGTRILRPAVARLVAAGLEVGVVTRSGVDLEALAFELRPGRVLPIPADHGDPVNFLAALDHAGGAGEAILYLPTAAEATIAAAVGRVLRRAVLIRTSAAAAPGARAVVPPLTRSGAPAAILQLGWRRGTDGESRWHDAEAISAAALALLASRQARSTLGSTSPWSSRPR